MTIHPAVWTVFATRCRGPNRLAPVEEVRDRAQVGRPRVAVADIRGEELDEAAGRPLPCSCYRRWNGGSHSPADDRGSQISIG